VDAPQRKKDAEAALSRARVELENADRELARQKALFDRGFVSRASMERAQTAREAAAASEATASQRMQTLEQDLTSEKKVLTSRVAQSEAGVRIARANRSRVFQSTQSVREAEKAVAQAKVSLRQARDAELQIQARRLDVRTAEASVARSRVTVQNASDNFRETRVVAPRPGVITRKYLEEGTIIPGAVSAFAEGTSIVEISDVTTMYVECRVDEADISNVRIGQKARIIVEAYPGTFVTGAVERIFPAAETENAVTTVRVRVKIDPQGLRLPDRPIRPGMNATVEFIQFQAANVLIVPAQAITREGDKTFVRVKGADQKNPAQVEVKVGRSGNDGVELLQGLTEGQEVVVAEIDLAAMRDRQDRMMRVQQGGLGSRGPSGPSQSRAGMGAGGGGGRPGGGGGGGR
jgi:HlyD family secretion protein